MINERQFPHLFGDPQTSGSALQILASGCRQLMDLVQSDIQKHMVPSVADGSAT